MRSKNLLTIFILFSLVFISCQRETECIDSDCFVNENTLSEQLITKSSIQEDIINLEEYAYTEEEDSLYIESLGWKIDSISDEGFLYIINNELIVYKHTLSLRRNDVQERLYGSTINQSAHHIYLNIDVDNEDDNEDLQSFIEAVNQWNNLPNCNIYFTSNYHSFNSNNEFGWFNVRVQIKYTPSFANMSNPTECSNGLGIFIEAPIDQNLPGGHIWVKTSNDTYNSLEADQKTFAFMHALGHLINLKDAEKGYNWIPDTSFSKYSIMTSYSYLNEWGMEWGGFTEDDMLDLASIYPLNKVVVTETTIQPPVDSLLMSNNLKLYKPYLFTTTYNALKRGINEVQCNYSISGGEYEMTQINDSTIRVIFMQSGQYTVSVTLNSNDLDQAYTNFHSATHTSNILGDKVAYPNSVFINKSFEVSWRYTNRQFPDATIEFTGVEKLFDNNSTNILSTSVSNGKSQVTIKDYGHYVLTMNALKPNGEVLEQKKIHIEKYYRPKMYLADTSYLFRGININCFSIDCEICQEDMSCVIPSGTPSWAFDVILDKNLKFANRCYIRRYKKYLRHMDSARRVDVRHVVDISSYVEMVYNKGIIALYEANTCPVTMPMGTGGLPEGATAEYLPYFAFIVPQDKIWVE